MVPEESELLLDPSTVRVQPDQRFSQQPKSLDHVKKPTGRIQRAASGRLSDEMAQDLQVQKQIARFLHFTFNQESQDIPKSSTDANVELS